VARKSRGKKGCRRRGLIKKLRRNDLKKSLQKSIAASVNVCVCVCVSLSLHGIVNHLHSVVTTYNNLDSSSLNFIYDPTFVTSFCNPIDSSKGFSCCLHHPSDCAGAVIVDN
jgi:hypothetical protein